MKKLISLALAIFMVLSLAVVAFAEERPSAGTIDNVKGTITINNINIQDGKPTATYAVYQILKVNSFDFTSDTYDYDYTGDDWKTFFVSGEGKDYVAPNDQGMLVWKGTSDKERVANFAKIALAYAKEKNIEPTKTTDTPDDQPLQYAVSGDKSIVFSDLQLGYYLIDSSVGALCGLSTTNPDGLINSKNGTPTLEKQVQEDLSSQWGKTNTADIGQPVSFRITIHVHDGAQNYVLHDTMEAGLTFDPFSVVVKLIDGSNTAADETLVLDTHYEIITENIGSETFNIKLLDPCYSKLNTNDRLVITYTAALNDDAQIGNGTAENPANENQAFLSFGENHNTPTDATTTKTYGLDLVKTDGQNKLLDGSEFRIYADATSNNEVPVVLVLDENGDPKKTPDGYNMYRKAKEGEAGATVIVVNGKVRIIGLDNGVYWLEETKHPDGYNKLDSRQQFTISDNNLDAIITNGIVSTNSGVQVINHSGEMLPETGGLGTLLFTVLGGTTALGTGVVLVTKKRMSKIKDED